MPSFDIVREVETPRSFRVASIVGQFDLTTDKIKEHFTGNIPIDEREWSVGIIYGHSGTGKTTIARELFGDDYITQFEYDNKSILDNFSSELSTKDITATLNSVGFSSPPSWLKPYAVLSNGEKMRVDLARAILSERDTIVFDEFTSVVDRTVAKIGSAALQKAVRRSGKRFVAVSCHDDVIDWLEPDWVFNTNDMTFEWCKKKDQISNSKYAEKAASGTFFASITI